MCALVFANAVQIESNCTVYTFCDKILIAIYLLHYTCIYGYLQLQLPTQSDRKSRLTIVGHEAKKKQAVRDERVLFTGSTALKLVNALNKLPLKLSLSYQGLSMF